MQDWSIRQTSQSHREHEIAITLVNLILLTAVKPAASWKYMSRFSVPSTQSSECELPMTGGRKSGVPVNLVPVSPSAHAQLQYENHGIKIWKAERFL